MPTTEARRVGVVGALRRYPVKSMQGEDQATLTVADHGVEGDRAWAALDASTGKVASAKRPKLWRELLRCSAQTTARGVEVTLPDGRRYQAGEATLDAALAALTGRSVRLTDTPPAGAQIDRAFPETQMAEGLGADVDYSLLVLGGGAPPGTFLDYAAMHLMPSATLDAIAALMPDHAVEPQRYRPNLIIRSEEGTPGFAENAWADGTIHIGAEVRLRVILLTPRCAIPMLAHGTLAPRPAALRVVAEQNRVEIPGFGNQPCAGVYVAVERGGVIHVGDEVMVVVS